MPQEMTIGEKIKYYRRKRLDWLIENKGFWYKKKICPEKIADKMFELGLYGKATKREDVTVQRALYLAEREIEKL